MKMFKRIGFIMALALVLAVSVGCARKQTGTVGEGTEDLNGFANAAERDHVAGYLGQRAEALSADIHWTLIRMAWASVADTAIAPLQDVLGLGAADRMNLPGEGDGHWAWRFGWNQVAPLHGERLAALTQLYGRA